MDAAPTRMAAVARSWDDQHLDLAAAAAQIGAASTAGFTSAVSGAAARFATTWSRHAAALGQSAESRADGLRATAEDYLRTDQAVAGNQLLLRSILRELR
ncbi:MAG: hypothetical protein WBP61_19710 [Nocardioides sp.]